MNALEKERARFLAVMNRHALMQFRFPVIRRVWPAPHESMHGMRNPIRTRMDYTAIGRKVHIVK